MPGREQLPSTLKRSPAKAQRTWIKKGPSDPQARRSGRAARDTRGETFGGVDLLGSSKEELYRRAREQ